MLPAFPAGQLAAVMTRQFDEHPGNYLAFFSSFDYPEKAATVLITRRPDIPQWRQARRMNADARVDSLARLDKLFGPGHGYADLVPAMQRVVQAARRVLRTPDDRGWLWLLDDRYRRAEVIELLPAWWQLAGTPHAPQAQAR